MKQEGIVVPQATLYHSVFATLYMLTEDERTAERLAEEAIIAWSRSRVSGETESAVIGLYREAIVVVLRRNALSRSAPERERGEGKHLATVKECVRRLPDLQRFALILNKYEHFSAAAMGKILGVSESRIGELLLQAYKTVSSRLEKADSL